MENEELFKEEIDKVNARIENLDERSKLMLRLLEKHTERFMEIIKKHNRLVDRVEAVEVGEKECLETYCH